MEYPWYEIITQSECNRILQGDLVFNCPVITPPIDYKITTMPEVEVTEYNVIVMSQSCDLVQDKVEIVLVCPFNYWSEIVENAEGNFKSRKSQEGLWNDLKKGNRHSHHLLMHDEKKLLLKEPIIINFKDIFGIHISALKVHLQKFESRLRLLPPYREHLSQSFARYFMRVGLPHDISSFDKLFPKTM